MPSQKTASSVDLTITGSMIAKSTSSYMASKRCVHILVRGSLLNIICRRLNINEPYLTTKYLDKTPIIRFKKTPSNPKNPLMRAYFQFLLGIKHAIERNYLKEVYLYFKDPTGDILEAYKFRLKYNSEGDKLYENTPEPLEVKLEIIRIFEVIKSLGNIEKLKNDTYPELQLFYNEDTPDDYDPPGFEKCRSAPHLDQVGPLSAHLGSVNTGYHKLHYFTNNQTLEKLLEDIPDEDDKQEPNDDVYEVDTEKNYDTDDFKSNDSFKESGMDPKILQRTPPFKKDKLNASNITVPDTSDDDDLISIASEKSHPLRETTGCYCLLKLSDDVEMIPCTECGKSVHSICQGYFALDSSSRKEFKCSICSNSETRNYESVEYARTRLLLYYSKKEGKLCDWILKFFPAEDKEELIEKAKSYNLINSDTSLNMDVLNAFLPTFFKNTGDSQMFE